MTRRPRVALLSLVVAAAVLLADVVTKRWAVSSLSGDNDRHVIWTLHWNLTHNSGMAFSSGTGLGPLIALGAMVVVVALLLGSARVESTLGNVAVGLILGGAVGNILDRIFRGDRVLHGSVIDFIDFRWFPVFNVADIGIDVGAALFALAMLLSSRRPRVEAVADADTVAVDEPELEEGR